MTICVYGHLFAWLVADGPSVFVFPGAGLSDTNGMPVESRAVVSFKKENHMKVFMCWSGARSQAVAQSLHDWMPLVLHYVQPWLSDVDIAAGERWAQSVAKELESTNFGIACLTRENVTSPWILFEAGSLAKLLGESRVIPLLLDLEFREITGPLAQFQAKKVDRDGLGEIIQAINSLSTQPIPEPRTKELFDVLWPKLEKQLTEVPKPSAPSKPIRAQHEVLEELVSSVRSLDSRLRDVEGMIADKGAPVSRRFRRRFHPMMLQEIMHMAGEPNDPIGILVMASMVREDMPWFYEIAREIYRAIESGDRATVQREMTRIRHISEMFMGGPLMEEFAGGERDAHMWLIEFPRMFEHMLRRWCDVEEKKPSPRRRSTKPPS